MPANDGSRIMNRCIVFIDGSNFYHMCKTHLDSTDVEFQAFAKKISGEGKLTEIRYYNAIQNQQLYPDAYKAQQKFLSRIRKIPNMSVILGKLKRRAVRCPRCKKVIPKCPSCLNELVTLVEKKTDVNLAIDLVQLAFENKYDIAIIVTGDGDFAGAVQLAKKYEKTIKHARFEGGFSTELNSVCDDEIVLNRDLFEGCYLDY